MVEQTVSCDCGERCFGILHQPSAAPVVEGRTGILFLNAGIRYRVGPYRQYVRLARRLCAQGYYVLRADMPGIGDAEGMIGNWNDYWQRIVENTNMTSAWIDSFLQHARLDRLILLGMCSGAHNALLTAVRDRRVEMVVLASLPFQPLNERNETGLARLTLRKYFARIWRLRTWWKLLTLQVNFVFLAASLRQLLPGSRESDVGIPVVQRELVAYLESQRPMLLIYGTDDPFYQGFCDEMDAKTHLAALPDQGNFEVVAVEGANHVFTQIAWQERLLQGTSDWLKIRLKALPQHVSPQSIHS